jgi:hypothetical protein
MLLSVERPFTKNVLFNAPLHEGCREAHSTESAVDGVVGLLQKNAVLGGVAPVERAGKSRVLKTCLVSNMAPRGQPAGGQETREFHHLRLDRFQFEEPKNATRS